MNTNGNNPNTKRKLTREELLAGKISIDDEKREDVPFDPRVKSPDALILALLSQKKNGPVKNKQLEIDTEEAKNRNETEFTGTPLPPLENEKGFEGLKSSPIINSDDLSTGAMNPNTAQFHRIGETGQNERTEYLALKERFDTEMARWKEYEQKVNHWKERVMEIVSHLKSDVKDLDALRQENKDLKKKLVLKDNELSELKQSLIGASSPLEDRAAS